MRILFRQSGLLCGNCIEIASSFTISHSASIVEYLFSCKLRNISPQSATVLHSERVLFPTVFMVGVCSLYSLKRLRNDHQNTVKNGIDTGYHGQPHY